MSLFIYLDVCENLGVRARLNEKRSACRMKYIRELFFIKVICYLYIVPIVNILLVCSSTYDYFRLFKLQQYCIYFKINVDLISKAVALDYSCGQ